jgi:hypothetical protein
MKRIFVLFFTLGIFLSGYCQDGDEFQTVLGNGKTRISGFGGPMMSFTRIGDDFAHMMGGGGGVIINSFFFGGYGMGKTNELQYRYDLDEVMDFGHGGFWVGYTAFQNKAIHPVFHTTMGWGAITHRPKNYEYSFDNDQMQGDQVFVICPTFELEMNFSRFFKLGGGVTYSFVYNTDGPYSYKDFANPGVFLSFKFGWF